MMYLVKDLYTFYLIFVGCVEFIMGMRPDFYGLRVAPSIPSEWDGFEIEKDFRGKHLHIVVKNPNHVESGFSKMLVNGVEMAVRLIIKFM